MPSEFIHGVKSNDPIEILRNAGFEKSGLALKTLKHWILSYLGISGE